MTQIIKKNYTILCICFIVSFLILLFFAKSVSPLTLYEGGDSCVFKQMGLIILQGKTPYVDLFDHKGPILYFINALGLWLGGRWGLFALCVLNFSLVLYYWKKISCLYVSYVVSIFAILFAIALYIIAIEDGNQTEDWSLLPLSYSLYLSLKMQKKELIPSKIEFYLMGISAGLLLFIRANNAALLVCSFTLIIYLLYTHKLYKTILNGFIFTLGGILSVAILLFAFFYIRYGQNGLEQMLYGTFIFNITAYDSYSSRSDFAFFFLNNMIYKMFILFGIILCIQAYVNNKGKVGNVVTTSFIVGSFIFCFYTLGRRSYNHYLITILPLYLYTACYSIRNRCQQYLLYTFIVIYIFLSPILDKIAVVKGILKNNDIVFFQKADSLIKTIEDVDKCCIWNYNAGFQGIAFLQRNNITQCNRIILPFQIDMSDYLRKTEINKLKSVRPKYILINLAKTAFYYTNAYYSKEDSVYIKQNYIRKDSINGELIVLERRK